MCECECVLTCPNRARATRAPRAHTENSRYHTHPNGQLSKLRGKRDGGLGDRGGGGGAYGLGNQTGRCFANR